MRKPQDLPFNQLAAAYEAEHRIAKCCPNPSPHHQAMKTKSISKDTGENSGKDLATFERMPKKTKDQLKLKEQGEKASGAEKVEVTEKIEDTQDPADKHRP